MQKKKYTVVANWKMNPETLSKAQELSKGVEKGLKKNSNTKVILCAPSVFLPILTVKKSKMISWGAQNMHWEKQGPYTGEISSKMVVGSGATYVILGHSERRALSETSDMVNKKILAALKSGLTPIVCIGERERDPQSNYLTTLKQQVIETFQKLPKASLKKIIVTYEPVWAISSHQVRPATPEESTEMVIFIKKILADMYGQQIVAGINFLYGGSVNPEDALSFIVHGNVSGLLVGHASLKAKTFLQIINSMPQN